MRRTLILILTLLCLCLTPGVRAATVPSPRSAGLMELHGTFHGERYWARLKASNPQELDGHRFLRLLYQQATMQELGGTLLIDHPILLLDKDHLGIRGWNESHSGVGMSGIVYEDLKDPPGYRITEGYLEGAGDAAVEQTRDEILAGPMAWDTRVAPILMAFAYQRGAGAMTIPGVDFYLAAPPVRVTITWTDATLTIGDTAYTLTADDQGRLQSVTPVGAEQPILTVTEWLEGG